MKIKIVFLIFYALFFSTPVFAKTQPYIKDPHELLKEVDRFIGWTTFEDTYLCGTKYTFQMNNCAQRCEPYYCEEICQQPKTTTITVKDCSDASVSFFSDKPAVPGRSWFTVKKENFKNRNAIRGWLGAPLNGISGKGNERIGKNYVTLDKIEYEDFTLKGGKIIKALRLHVIYSYWNEELIRYNNSHQAMVVGHANETGGLFLEHRFYEVSKPVSHLIKLSRPNR